MRQRLLLLALIVGGGNPLLAQTPEIGVAVHAGTLGVGGDLAVSPSSRVSFRGGANFIPVDVDLTASDIDFTIDLPSPQFTLLLDLYLAGGFRLSGGLLFSSDDVNLEGDFTGSIEIGNAVYGSTEIGTLTGAIINNDVAPYAGIGFGNPAGSRVGFFLDLGVAFQGKPAVALDADGTLAGDPVFEANLESERQSVEDDVDIFRYYPVVSIGFSIGF